MAEAERQGRLTEKTRFYTRASLLIVPSRRLPANHCRAMDDIGYLPIGRGGVNLFFQLVNARYEKGVFAHGPRTDGGYMGHS